MKNGQTILHKGQKVYYYTTEYHQRSLVLLHGFTESSGIWDDYTSVLQDEYQLITIDLPGHGQSDLFGPVHSMEFMADIVQAILEHLGIRKTVMVGHSMGGYVTLAFARKYLRYLHGIGLFHSHAAPDDEAAKINRDRLSDIIIKDKKNFIHHFIPGLFAEQNRHRFTAEINLLRSMCSGTTEEGIIAALQGMKVREDHRPLLKELPIPIMFISGKNDEKIPPEKIKEQLLLPQITYSLLLEKAGHMGFIEARDECLHFMRSFVGRCYQ